MPYNDPSGIVIADFSHPELFIKEEMQMELMAAW
jgi:hypothetical protein